MTLIDDGSDSWVVIPQQIRIPLSGGRWVSVKKQLNARETFTMMERAAPGVDVTMGAAALRNIPPAQIGLALISAYLLDWNLVDPEGAPLVLAETTAAEKEAIVSSFTLAAVTELITVVTAHDARTRQEQHHSSGVPA